MNPINLIIMLLLISLLILVHEWGHYIAARIFGVRVSKFGIGMPIGPTLYKTKKGDLEIIVHAFLLGGYVSFPDDEEEGKDTNLPVLPKDSPERLMNKAAWQKAIIFAAGVIMNFVFALFLIILTAGIFHKLPTGKSDIYVAEIIKDGVIATNYPNTLKADDKILKVNDIVIDAGYKFIYLVQNSKERDGKIDKSSANENVQKLLKLNPSLKENEIIPNKLKVKLPKQTAEKTVRIDNNIENWIKTPEIGDTVLNEDEIKLRDEIANKQIYISDGKYTVNQLANAISDTYRPLNITVLRKGKIIEFKNINSSEKGVLGVALKSSEIYKDTNTLSSILKDSFVFAALSTRDICQGFKLLFTGKIPMSELHGIIAITKIGSDFIQYQGFIKAILLTANISINLAIFNLLPIPALDGGHLMFLLIEKIVGKPLNEEAINKISGFFFTLLLILLVIVVFNDVWALIMGKF